MLAIYDLTGYVTYSDGQKVVSSLGLNGFGESGAIQEGVTETLGILSVAKETGNEPNWNAGAGCSFEDPEADGYPAAYRGDNWASTSSENDAGNIHINYTIIPYITYLLYSGMNGEGSSLSVAKLQKLWKYAALRLMPDATFQQTADAVYETAKRMNAEGTLSTGELTTVETAFDAANLPVTEGFAAAIAPTEKTKKETTTPDEMDVVKTMTYGVGPSTWKNDYLYDFSAKECVVNNKEVETADGWGDVGEYTDPLDGLICSAILLKHPEIAVSLQFDSMFESTLLAAYNPLITSGQITKMTVNVDYSHPEADDRTDSYEFVAKDNQLQKMMCNLYGDVPAAYYFDYDDKGRVISVDIWPDDDESVKVPYLRLTYTETDGVLSGIKIVKPQDWRVYEEIFESKCDKNGQIQNGTVTYVDNNYVEYGDWDNPTRMVFDPYSIKAKYDKNKNLISLKYSGGADSAEANGYSMNLSYDSKGNIVEMSNGTFTYQTIKLS